MGGTSFDVAVVAGGAAERRVRAELFGLWTGTAMVAVGSIGAGGGSVAWVDARGLLRVGPRSAGADPGPACYGRGGREPTVTDALVALGLIDPQHFLGGRFVLDGERAAAALARLGEAVGLGPAEAARGVYRLAAEQMTLAVRSLFVERGLDPRRFAFLCYGGCGPLFGATIARTLGIGRVLVLALSAVFSATGAATADVRREATRTFFRPLPVDPGEVARCFAALEAEVTAAMRAEGIGAARTTLRREADVRFHRQNWEVTVPLRALDRTSLGRLGADFRARYAALYGPGALATRSAMDLVNCRVIATGRVPRPSLAPAPLGPARAAPALVGRRMGWLPGSAQRTRVAVYDGERLAPGMTFAGPALVERRDTTILLAAGDRAAVDGLGGLAIEVARG